jgi:Ca-activated chloride channel homolog
VKINPNDPKWTAYVLGELDDQERATIEQMLESSSEARALVDELRVATTMLKDELATSPVALDAGQRSAIYAAASQPARRWFLPRAATWAAGLAAAGLILFAVITPSLLRSRQGDAPGAAPLQMSENRQKAPAAGGPIPSDSPSVPVAPSVEPKNERAQLGQAAGQAVTDPTGLMDERELSKLQQASPADIEVDIDSQDFARERQEVRADAKKDAAVDTLVQANPSAVSNQDLQKAEALVTESFGGLRAAEVANSRAVPTAPSVAPPPMRAPVPVPDVISRPRFNTEAYDRITDNPFIRVNQDPLATFSIDVDTASYANLRRFLTQNQLPPKDAVRIEEMINYFTYDYPQPRGPHPIGAQMEVASAPWNPQHRLVRIGIKGKDLDLTRRPSSNLVFLVDVSGSMQPPEKLPLLKNAMKMLIDNLTENDRVSMVVYAGASGTALPPTTGDRKDVILRALERLEAGGSTNGASGIQLAYNLAVSNYIPGGTNRVILATDGDFNVGVTNQGDLIRLIEDKAKSGVFLSVLGFGLGNLKDSTLEKLADSGNGNYAYIDTLNEARKVLVEQMGGTLITIAKDVKIQIEFNPAQVNAYRLIGYENRVLRNEDFNNDLKDAGDMGAGHTVTALFEVVPSGVDVPVPGVDPLRYQRPAVSVRSNARETLTLKVRYKDPEGSQSKLLEAPLVDSGRAFNAATTDFRFAASVAAFGMILRDSPYKGSASLGAVLDMAEGSRGQDRNGYRQEFIQLVNRARSLAR